MRLRKVFWGENLI